MKSILLAAAVVVAMTSSAFAKHCPKDVKIIDQSLSTATGMDKMQMTKVKTMRDEGDAFHKSGKHAEAIKVLHEAITILGVKPYMPM